MLNGDTSIAPSTPTASLGIPYRHNVLHGTDCFAARSLCFAVVDLTEVARRDQVVDMHVPQGSTILCRVSWNNLSNWPKFVTLVR